MARARVLLLSAALLLPACAKMEPPPGGPVDSRRPFVTGAFPAPHQTSTPRDLQAKLVFSEWIDPEAERGRVFLSPPPAKKAKVEIQGPTLTVTFPARLDSGTTYTLGVVGAVKDLHGLSLEKPFQLIFSTGSKLDSGKAGGLLTVFSASVTTRSQPPAGAFAALYPEGPLLRARFSHLRGLPPAPGDAASTSSPSHSSRRVDSLANPAREAPAYLAPADSTGRFAFSGVMPGKYRLLGFQDADQDLSPDAGQEQLAIGPLVEASSSGGAPAGLTLGGYDTVPARLTAARWSHETMVASVGSGLPANPSRSLGTVRLKFSRPMHPIQALRRDFYAVSKVGKNWLDPAVGTKDWLDPAVGTKASSLPPAIPIPVLDIAFDPNTGDVELYTPPLEKDSIYRIVASPPDAQGGPMDSSRDEASFRVGVVPDSTQAVPVFLGAPKLNGSNGANGLNGSRDRLPAENLFPGRGILAYYPRILTDSMLSLLRSRLEAKLDTIRVAMTITRKSHHEMWLRFAPFVRTAESNQPFVPTAGSNQPIPLKGQRLRIEFKAAETAKTGTGDSLRGTQKPADLARPAATLAPDSLGGLSPEVFSATFQVADSSQLGSLKFLPGPTAAGAHLVLRSLGSAFQVSRTAPAAGTAEWVIDSLPAGWYSADAFQDRDADGRWSPGRLSPWTSQEPWSHLADSLQVKPKETGIAVPIAFPPDG